MKYYALFFTAQYKMGATRTCMIKVVFTGDKVHYSERKKITSICELVEKRHPDLNPKTIQPHFLVEITEEEYNRP